VRPERYLTHKQCGGSPAQGSCHCIFCVSRNTTTVDEDAADAEAKLMLANNVTVPSNGFVIRDARSPRRCQAITTSRVGLLSIAKSKDNKVTVYDDHLLILSIVLSDAKKRL
jgi:hypothetical protein